MPPRQHREACTTLGRGRILSCVCCRCLGVCPWALRLFLRPQLSQAQTGDNTLFSLLSSYGHCEDKNSRLMRFKIGRECFSKPLKCSEYCFKEKSVPFLLCPYCFLECCMYLVIFFSCTSMEEKEEQGTRRTKPENESVASHMKPRVHIPAGASIQAPFCYRFGTEHLLNRLTNTSTLQVFLTWSNGVIFISATCQEHTSWTCTILGTFPGKYLAFA